LEKLKYTIQTIEDDIVAAARSIKDLEAMSDHLSSMIIQDVEDFLAVTHFHFLGLLLFSSLLNISFLPKSKKATFASCAE